MTETGLFHGCFMADIFVVTPTRWTLRRAAGIANDVLVALRMAKRPDKTFIGRIERGFDFLGYHFTACSLTLARGTPANFADIASRLYEQGRERPNGPSRLVDYVKHWCGWARGGLAMVVPGLTLVSDGPLALGGSDGPASAAGQP